VKNRLLRNFVIVSTASFFIFILWIISLANSGSSNVLFLVNYYSYGDKVGHFFIYGLLAFGLSIALNFKSLYVGKIKIYLGVLLVFIFAVGEELLQAFYPKRTMDVYDVLADVIGLIVFSILLHFIENRVKEVES